MARRVLRTARSAGLRASSWARPPCGCGAAAAAAPLEAAAAALWRGRSRKRRPAAKARGLEEGAKDWDEEDEEWQGKAAGCLLGAEQGTAALLEPPPEQRARDRSHTPSQLPRCPPRAQENERRPGDRRADWLTATRQQWPEPDHAL